MSKNIKMTMEKFTKKFETKLNKFIETIDDEKISMIIEEFIQQRISAAVNRTLSDKLLIDSWGDIRSESPIYKKIESIVEKKAKEFISNADDDKRFQIPENLKEKVDAYIDKRFKRMFRNCIDDEMEELVEKKMEELIKTKFTENMKRDIKFYMD